MTNFLDYFVLFVAVISRGTKTFSKQKYKEEQKMNIKKQTIVIALAVITALTMTFSMISGQAIQDKQSPDSLSARETPVIAREKTIEGVWRLTVTPRNCQTGLPAAPAFRSVFMFNKGGTMDAYGVGPGQTPALVSPEYGLWQREQGWQDYSFKFLVYRYNTSGVYVGWNRIRATLELGESGDDFTTNAAIEVFDANDNLIGNGCATSVGTRFE